MTEFKPGDLVKVRQGKYAGNLFVVISTEGDSRAVIADGSFYKCERPKRKNVKHLQKTQINLEDVAGRIANGEIPDNGWLIREISAMTTNGSISCKQGG